MPDKEYVKIDDNTVGLSPPMQTFTRSSIERRIGRLEKQIAALTAELAEYKSMLKVISDRPGGAI